jgi:hypothetical protein
MVFGREGGWGGGGSLAASKAAAVTAAAALTLAWECLTHSAPPTTTPPLSTCARPPKAKVQGRVLVYRYYNPLGTRRAQGHDGTVPFIKCGGARVPMADCRALPSCRPARRRLLRRRRRLLSRCRPLQCHLPTRMPPAPAPPTPVPTPEADADDHHGCSSDHHGCSGDEYCASVRLLRRRPLVLPRPPARGVRAAR